MIRNALKGGFGRISTSDYVVDEAIKTALMRTKRHDLAIDLGTYIIESPGITRLWIAEDSFEMAWEKFKAFSDKPPGFIDCASLALMEKNHIKQIMSFDSGFDGLVQRIY